MSTLIQNRRGTAAAWLAANPVLSLGELGIETDTYKFKVGNGSTSWNSLTYMIDAVISAAIAVLIDSAPTEKNTIGKIATALIADEATATALAVTVAGKTDTAAVNSLINASHTVDLGLFAPKVSPAFSGTPTGITKTHVGLGNVDNTSDANKPVSIAQAAADALKAPTANPTFTGTVFGVTKTHVGLGNVDNTSDANKPVSTAQAATLAPLASPAFTGTPTIDGVAIGASGIAGVLLLAAGAAIPGGTPANTIIARTP